jgi:hypothetical protein
MMPGRIAVAAVAALLVAGGLAAGSARAAFLNADYRFQDTYSSSVPPGVPMTDIGPGNKFVTETVGCKPTRVLSFPKGSGLQVQSGGIAANTNWYSIVVLFRLADLSNYRRIMAPSGNDTTFDTDNGLYENNGRLAIYDNTVTGNPFFGPSAVFAPNTYAEVAFVYRSTGSGPENLTAGYVNGIQQVIYPTPSNNAHFAYLMRFFKDNDTNGGLNEDSAGAVARIRIYNADLNAGEVASIFASSPIAGKCDPAKHASAAVNGKVRVKGGKHGRLVVLTGIDASCPAGVADCSGTAAVDKRGASQRLASNSRVPKHLGKTTISVGAGETQAVKVKLTRKASDALRARGKLKVKISVDLSLPGATAAVASRTAKLKPPKPKHH